ncbi:hypothetical protein QBC47DRAFT_374124 [Echria macrotheca]|uniref:Uncharacterized protein n=1 Tax=Echria macrotheca TaxID=438768 RepID=A0AAJ0FCE3_9PEZI|nr:hypothetical protein QBC47DRAFT_374124 [Echria macrotheca]
MHMASSSRSRTTPTPFPFGFPLLLFSLPVLLAVPFLAKMFPATIDTRISPLRLSIYAYFAWKTFPDPYRPAMNSP